MFYMELAFDNFLLLKWGLYLNARAWCILDDELVYNFERILYKMTTVLYTEVDDLLDRQLSY